MHCTVRQFLHHGIPTKNFAGLMELYECSYIRLRNLVPDLDAVPDEMISRVAGALDLHVRITERCKFTTTFNLTYYFNDREGRFPAPDMRVRMYHDAQVCEVISCGRRRGFRNAVYNRMYNSYSLTEKWRMNRFLQKWLGYSLMQGHRFIPGRIILPTDDIPEIVEQSRLIVES